MPLTKDFIQGIRELFLDNKKKEKAKGANGKPWGKTQTISAALSAAGKENNKNKHIQGRVK